MFSRRTVNTENAVHRAILALDSGLSALAPVLLELPNRLHRTGVPRAQFDQDQFVQPVNPVVVGALSVRSYLQGPHLISYGARTTPCCVQVPKASKARQTRALLALPPHRIHASLHLTRPMIERTATNEDARTRLTTRRSPLPFDQPSQGAGGAAAHRAVSADLGAPMPHQHLNPFDHRPTSPVKIKTQHKNPQPNTNPTHSNPNKINDFRASV